MNNYLKDIDECIELNENLNKKLENESNYNNNNNNNNNIEEEKNA